MQRMKLHTSGVKLNRLGSIQDRVMRSYLVKEAELEAKKNEFLMLISLTNPNIADGTKRAEWGRTIQKSWQTLLSRLFYVDIPETTPEEELLKTYYEQVVSKVRPTLHRDKKTRKLSVSGIDTLK